MYALRGLLTVGACAAPLLGRPVPLALPALVALLAVRAAVCIQGEVEAESGIFVAVAVVCAVGNQGVEKLHKTESLCSDRAMRSIPAGLSPESQSHACAPGRPAVLYIAHEAAATDCMKLTWGVADAVSFLAPLGAAAVVAARAAVLVGCLQVCLAPAKQLCVGPAALLCLHQKDVMVAHVRCIQL